MVDGQPERVQSPARVRFGNLVDDSGRFASRPGAAEKVAFISLTTCDWTTAASRAAGRNSEVREGERDDWHRRFGERGAALMTVRCSSRRPLKNQWMVQSSSVA
jgi:hypothetical protein